MTEYIPLIVALLGSGGILGGIYALMKLRPEAGQIVVTAAQGALVVQSGVIDTLRSENEDLRRENAELRERVKLLEIAMRDMRKHVRKLERDNGHTDEFFPGKSEGGA